MEIDDFQLYFYDLQCRLNGASKNIFVGKYERRVCNIDWYVTDVEISRPLCHGLQNNRCCTIIINLLLQNLFVNLGFNFFQVMSSCTATRGVVSVSCLLQTTLPRPWCRTQLLWVLLWYKCEKLVIINSSIIRRFSTH